MALTKIQSKLISTFIQPNIGDIVPVIISSDIDWLKTGVSVYIVDGGVYEIVSSVANVYNLKLITAEKDTGSTVSSKSLFPVSPNDTGAASKTYVVQEIGFISEPIGSDTDYIIINGVDIDIDIPDPANHPGRVIRITNFFGSGYVNLIGYPIKPFDHPYEIISQLGGWVTANPELIIPRSIEIISTGTEWVVINLSYGVYEYYPPPMMSNT